MYEVIRVYGGRPYLLQEHLDRMAGGIRALEIPFDGFDRLRDVAFRLMEENGVDDEGNIYIQVTRGAAPRKHAFPPADTPPTVYVSVKPARRHPDAYYEEGVDAITTPDTRWARCDIKSIALLPNVLANQKAHAAGAFEALFIRDGIVLEGSHSNVMAVVDGTLVTYPTCNYILAGITRDRILALAARLGVPIREGAIPVDRLHDVDELFLTGTTTEVIPVTRVDGRTIGPASGPPSLAAAKASQPAAEPRPAPHAPFSSSSVEAPHERQCERQDR